MFQVVFVLVALAAAGPSPAQTATPLPGLTAERMADGKAFYDVVVVDLTRQSLRLYWRDAHGQALESFEALRGLVEDRGEDLVFATNAGIYGKDQRPLGLHVADGVEERPLNRGRGGGNFFLVPNGVFSVEAGRARILTTEDYAASGARPDLAVQSGPLLLLDGALHPRFLVDSDSRYIRNGVGLRSPTEVVFVLSNRPVNFHTFATFFRERLQCRDALYLDGTLSDFYLPALQRRPAGREFVGMLAVTATKEAQP
jgi:uncharacterized protein YigE (DUF2233 family)